MKRGRSRIGQGEPLDHDAELAKSLSAQWIVTE